MNRKKPLLRKPWTRGKQPRPRGKVEVRIHTGSGTPASEVLSRMPEGRYQVIEQGRRLGRTFLNQLELFRHLYREQGGLCAITQTPLLPPQHPLFHAQGSHLLPKGSYPLAKLWECNTIMIQVARHDTWTNTGNKWDLVNGNDQIEGDERWRPHVELYERLQRFYNTSTRDEREQGPPEEVVHGSGPVGTASKVTTGGPGTGAGGNQGGTAEGDDLPF